MEKGVWNFVPRRRSKTLLRAAASDRADSSLLRTSVARRSNTVLLQQTVSVAWHDHFQQLPFLGSWRKIQGKAELQSRSVDLKLVRLSEVVRVEKGNDAGHELREGEVRSRLPLLTCSIIQSCLS